MERKPQVCVLKDVGTNCDEETMHAFIAAGADARIVLLNDLKARNDSLANFNILAFPGGFSRGDDARAGILQAKKLQIYLGDEVNDFINHQGLVYAACNGFQVLVNSGLLPGGKLDGKIRVALASNRVGHFTCQKTDLRVEKDSKCLFIEALPDRLTFPVAHGEGRFTASAREISRIEAERLVVFRHIDNLGNPTMQYPENPNGAVNAIAGITDRTGRILGMMPHAERAYRIEQDPNWRRHPNREPQGLPIFKAMVDYAKAS